MTENEQLRDSSISYSGPFHPVVEEQYGNDKDWTEELCIVVVGLIAVTAIFILKNDSVPIVTGLGGGLIGYLTRGFKQKLS